MKHTNMKIMVTKFKSEVNNSMGMITVKKKNQNCVYLQIVKHF